MLGERTPLVPDEARAPGIFCLHTRSSVTILTFVFLVLSIWVKQGTSDALSSLLPDIEDDGFEYAVAYLPGIGRIAYFVGKALQIVVIDLVDVRATLAMSGLVAGTATLVMSFQTPETWMLMATAFAIGQVANAFVWGSASRLIAYWCDDGYLGRGISIFVLSYDVGDILTSLFFSRMITFTTWRVCYVVVGAAAVSQGTLNSIFLRPSPAHAGFAAASDVGSTISTRSSKPDAKSREQHLDAKSQEQHPIDELRLSAAFCLFLSDGRFWLAVIANVSFGLWSIFANYLTEYGTKELGYSHSSAVLLQTITSVGFATGDILGGFGRDCMSPRLHRLMSAGFSVASALALTTIAIAQAAERIDIVQVLLPPALVIGALGQSLQWGVNLTFWVIEFSGPRHASTAMGTLDVFLTAVSVPTTFWAGALASDGNFTPIIVLVFAGNVIGQIATNSLLFCSDFPPERPAAAQAGDAKI